MIDRTKILFQHLLPKQTLTELAGWVARGRGGSFTTWLIRWFVGRYHVAMHDAAEADVTAYKSFNDFFTRGLKAGLRPLAAAEYVSPVDGAVSLVGSIDDSHILQAKGHRYTVTDLVGGDNVLAAQFRLGSFANLYLSPKDYHRLHMPCTGRLTRMIHVPGTLFSVNPLTARHVPNLFARNERVVCVFETARQQPFVMVLVGATIVGSIATTWHGVVNSKRSQQVSEWHYDDQDIVLEQGEEMGRFLLGSTVIMLFDQPLTFNARWHPQISVRLGETMANPLSGD